MWHAEPGVAEGLCRSPAMWTAHARMACRNVTLRDTQSPRSGGKGVSLVSFPLKLRSGLPDRVIYSLITLYSPCRAAACTTASYSQGYPIQQHGEADRSGQTQRGRQHNTARDHADCDITFADRPQRDQAFRRQHHRDSVTEPPSSARLQRADARARRSARWYGPSRRSGGWTASPAAGRQSRGSKQRGAIQRLERYRQASEAR
jgi:hypothetical protein